MQVSNIINKVNFGNLKVNEGFYDTHIALLRQHQTSKSYQDAYSTLENVSGNKNLELRKLGDYGAVVAEVDNRGKVLNYISKDFNSAVCAMQIAAIRIQKENKEETPRKKPFEGHN